MVAGFELWFCVGEERLYLIHSRDEEGVILLLLQLLDTATCSWLGPKF
jgi:hypothetical protein